MMLVMRYRMAQSILMSGVIYGALAGVISTLMMGMAAGDQDYALNMQKVNAWMTARKLKQQGTRVCL